MSRHQPRSTSQTNPSTPSPPKPVPALHGSLALPYARNPSGTDSIINEPRAPYLSQIWGIKSKVTQLEPGGSSSKQWSFEDNPPERTEVRGRNDEGIKAKENMRGGGWQVDCGGPLASGSGGRRKSGGKKVVIVDDPNQVIGRRKAGGLGESSGSSGMMGMPLRGETRGESREVVGYQQGSGRQQTGEVTRSQSGPSRSNAPIKTSSNSGFLSTSTSEPVLAALAFQAKLLSPEKLRPRQSLSPHRSLPASESVGGQAHVIDGYGPPQPPTVSPVSAERKAAMLAADKRKREQAGGRSPGKSPSGRSWGQELSPGGGMSARGDDGGNRMSRSGARREVEQVSPGRPERSKSWAERMADQVDRQQRVIDRLPSMGGTTSAVEAKMRYSPAHGKWISVGKPDTGSEDKAVESDRARSKIPPIDFIDTQRNPFLDPPDTQINPDSKSLPSHTDDDFVQRPRSPYDFSHLKGSLDTLSGPVKMGQHAGLGLGRPGLMSAGSIFGGGSAAAPGQSIWSSLKEPRVIKALPTKATATKRTVSAPVPDNKPPADIVAKPTESSVNNDRSQHDGRRIVSEPALASEPNAVTSGFASFMSNTRIVSDPLPAGKGKKWPKRRKGAKQPVVEDWSILKQKFVAGETTQDFQKVDKAVRQVADVFTKSLPKPNTNKLDDDKAQQCNTTSLSNLAQGSTKVPAARKTQQPLHQILQSRTKHVATSKEVHASPPEQDRDRDARYAIPRDHTTARRHNDAQQYRGRIRSDKPRIRSTWTAASQRLQNNNDNDQDYSVSTTGHALPKPKPE